MTERRTFWCSFCDDGRPAGQRFLGVAVVDVTPADVDGAPAWHPVPADKVDGPWVLAAVRLCWKAGVNPGGRVMLSQLDDDSVEARRFPRLTLLSQADLDLLYYDDGAPS